VGGGSNATQSVCTCAYVSARVCNVCDKKLPESMAFQKTRLTLGRDPEHNPDANDSVGCFTLGGYPVPSTECLSSLSEQPEALGDCKHLPRQLITC